jgi:hypothetical protein
LGEEGCGAIGRGGDVSGVCSMILGMRKTNIGACIVKVADWGATR